MDKKRKTRFAFILAAVAAAGFVVYLARDTFEVLVFSPTPSFVEPGTSLSGANVPAIPPPAPATAPEEGEPAAMPPQEGPVAVVAEKLSVPWEIAFLPGGDMLVTERPGRLRRIGRTTALIPVEGGIEVGESGLLGLALHPSFAENRLVYLYMTARRDGALVNRIVRYRFEDDGLHEPFVIIDGIPGAQYHDGGRIAFGPDGKLYATTGDASRADLAQDRDSLAGKVLRLNDDGSVPEDNPFGTAVWSYGHRNPQGIDWDDRGRLWQTEHGRSGAASGYDELNLIEAGKNYGWPTIQGDGSRAGMERPVRHSGAWETWAPADAAYLDGSIWFSGLRGVSLYQAKLGPDGSVADLKAHFRGDFGRLRAVVAGPDGMLYVSTSNTDGRGDPAPNDDRILRIDPRQLR
jgi:glucose/arabinose dehydrogenase